MMGHGRETVFVQNIYFISITMIRPLATSREVGDWEKLSPRVRIVRMQTVRGLSGSWIDPDHVFTFLEEGEADFILERKRWHLAAGDALIMPPRLRHVVLASAPAPLTLYVAHFDLFPPAANKRAARSREAELLREPPVVHLSPSARQAVRAAFQRLHDAFHSDRPWRSLETKGLMTELIALLLDGGEAEMKVSAQASGWSRIRSALDLLHGRYADGGLRIADVARAATLSPSHFALLFRKQMGMPIHRYLRELRIRRACALMADRATPLAELARSTGFADVYSFSKAFRKVTGMAPGKFRKGTEAEASSDSQRENLGEARATHPPAPLPRPDAEGGG
jgi:AraC-like DNA-binding protein